jgi:hypothetical protein
VTLRWLSKGGSDEPQYSENSSSSGALPQLPDAMAQATKNITGRYEDSSVESRRIERPTIQEEKAPRGRPL